MPIFGQSSCSYHTMTLSSNPDPIATIAANYVLKSLGTDMYEVVKFHLRHHHKIWLDEINKPTFTLIDLSHALNHLIGEGAAELIMQDIYIELDSMVSSK